MKAARVAELDPTADLAQVKVEAGLGQLSVEELVRRLVANGNGNGNGGGSGGGGTGVGSAVVGGRASPAGSVSGASGAPRPPKACFKCGSLTHLASECPYRATPQ